MKDNEMNDAAARIYEIGFLVSPSVNEADVEKETAAIAALIQKNGASVIDSEAPRLRRLAYPIYKVIGADKLAATAAYFGWTKFEGPAESAPAIEKGLSGMENLLRSIVITSVRERTYIPREGEEAMEAVEAPQAAAEPVEAPAQEE